MSNKHDANVRKSPLVNFQIGLVASLLFAFVMFEMYTAIPVVKDKVVVEPPEEPTYVWNQQFKVYKEPEQKTVAVKKAKPVVDPTEFDIRKDDDIIKDLDNEFKNDLPSEEDSIDPSSIVVAEPDEVPVSVPFTAIENVPVFPGCEKLKTNRERAECFSKKIRKIVSRRFNTDLGQRYGLKGLQRIYTQFDVDPNGMITNIQIHAPHPKLDKEAKRVINSIPQVTPGKQRNTPVTVKYQLPIMFKVQD